MATPKCAQNAPDELFDHTGWSAVHRNYQSRPGRHSCIIELTLEKVVAVAYLGKHQIMPEFAKLNHVTSKFKQGKNMKMLCKTIFTRPCSTRLRASALWTSFIRMDSHGEIFFSRQRTIHTAYRSRPRSSSNRAFSHHFFANSSYGGFWPSFSSQIASRTLLRWLAFIALGQRKRCDTAVFAY